MTHHRSRTRSCKRKKRVSYMRHSPYKTKVVACRTKHPKSPSRGWARVAPKLRSQRRKLKEKCGSKCFLSPKDLKFPVCKKTSRKGKCNASCSGILSAYRRARQYKHSAIANKALRLAKKKRCSWLRQ